jgi:ankyrin repeat protein
MKTCTRKIVGNILLAGYLLGGTELLYGGRWNRIHWAVYRNNMDELDRILADDTENLEGVDEDGRTPLCLAVELRNRAAIQRLLQAGADLGGTELLYGGRWNQMHWAVYHDDMGAVNRILANGIRDLEGVDENGRTPLRLAVDLQNIAITRRLLQAGADVNTQDRKGKTPLMSATANGNLKIMEELIQAGADVNLALYAFFNHVFSPRPDVSLADKIALRAEIERRDNYSRHTVTDSHPLGIAIIDINLPAVEMLLKAGARVNGPINRDIIPKLIAQSRGVPNEIEALTPAQRIKMDAIIDLLQAKYREQ